MRQKSSMGWGWRVTFARRCTTHGNAFPCFRICPGTCISQTDVPTDISSSPGLPGRRGFYRTHCERQCFKERTISLRGDQKEAREQGVQPGRRWGTHRSRGRGSGGGPGLQRGARRWSPHRRPSGQAVAPLAGFTQETAGGIGSARHSWAGWCRSPSDGGPRAAPACQGPPAPGRSA